MIRVQSRCHSLFAHQSLTDRPHNDSRVRFVILSSKRLDFDPDATAHRAKRSNPSPINHDQKRIAKAPTAQRTKDYAAT